MLPIVVINKAALLCLASLVCFVQRAAADSPADRWAAQTTPSRGAPRSIGEYSAGCLQGARALPLEGEGYLVMHPSRGRYYGHPSLLRFLQSLGRTVHEHGLASLLIGDMSQPRGGRAPGGHASHQTGLDVDLWYWHPPHALRHPPTKAERESLKALTVLDASTHALQSQWATRVTELLRWTASDASVARVFVHPVIKRALCALPDTDRSWLAKLRPWWGHDDHFHVRLACPSDSPNCTPQSAQPAGDGCAELDYWFSDAARADRERGQQDYQAKVARTPVMPKLCEKVLEP